MLRKKVLAGALSFGVALAVPWWSITTETTPAPASSAAGAAASDHEGTTHDDSPSADAAAPGGEEAHDWQAMDREMAKRDKSFPAKTEGKGAQPLEPKVLADGTKQFTLTAKSVKWEVEPGKVVDAMSYNGAVPGPTLHVDVGDKVEVVLKNELRESTVIHWHGIPIENAMDGVANITQDPVPPGKSFTYKIKAERASVGWYHSHHNGTEQVTNGLWGAFLIGDMPLPDKTKIAQEIPIELQDAGAIGLTLNGKSFPATEPVRVRKGDSVLIHYFNAGTMAHPMHLHGLDQLVVAKDGFPLDSPYKADTVLVAPGERYSVLVKADRPGKWAFHCHIFPHSEGKTGMFGMFTEMIVS
ncbi:multicopper oxidase family protein [Streptomyces sp. NPDC086080]|uniref:multicopper oxidase family protein n=1 Tax=Streptomyces sp. NPDC086080 TaxID=3365748 RepID=UPI0037D15CB3